MQSSSIFFHNLTYMLNKLGVTPYQLYKNKKSGNQEINPLQGLEYLPAYATLSKLAQQARQVEESSEECPPMPSDSVVIKLTNFYNANLYPKITVYDFKTVYLRAKDESISRSAPSLDVRFCGSYYGYYFDKDSGQICGALLKISKRSDQLPCMKAALITGLQSDEDLFSEELRTLLKIKTGERKDDREEDISEEGFSLFRNKLENQHQSCYLYKGDVKIINESILIYFQSVDQDAKQLALTMDISAFPSHRNDYLGGIAFVMSAHDRSHNALFYLMGLRSCTLGDKLKLTQPDLPKKLLLKSIILNENANLNSELDKRWFIYIIDNQFSINQPPK